MLATPNRNRLTLLLKTLFGKRIKYPYVVGRNQMLDDTIHLREYSKDDLVNLLERVGFRVILAKGLWLGIPRYNIRSCDFKALTRYSHTLLVKGVKTD